jgi:hypothetical protein
MAKSADAADLKSAGAYPPWGFKSPSGHQKIKELVTKTAIYFEVAVFGLMAVLMAVGFDRCALLQNQL